MNHVDPTDIYRVFHPITLKYTFFSNTHKICTKKDHILGHTTSHKILKAIPVHRKSVLWGIKLGINNRKMYANYPNI
jgi:hypothetical protein